MGFNQNKREIDKEGKQSGEFSLDAALGVDMDMASLKHR